MENLQMIGDCLFLNSPKTTDTSNDVENDEYMLLEDFLSPKIKHIDNDLTDLNATKSKLTQLSIYITVEEVRLQELEKKRQELESEMDRLQNEIEKEKILYRQAIDNEIERRQQMICSCHIPKQSNTVSQPNASCVLSIDPLDFRGEDVENRIKECRDVVQEKNYQLIKMDGNIDIEKLKQNLISYRKTMNDSKRGNLIKHKRHTAAKIFHKHLEEIDSKCNLELDKLQEIKKGIDTLDKSPKIDYSKERSPRA